MDIPAITSLEEICCFLRMTDRSYKEHMVELQAVIFELRQDIVKLEADNAQLVEEIIKLEEKMKL